jgi:hypothetical protein
LEDEQAARMEACLRLTDSVLRNDELQERLIETKGRLVDAASRLQFVISVLGAPVVEPPKYLAFRYWFREEFVRFANEESLYDREAAAILRLQAVEDELRLIGRVPLFQKKTIIAVAGGFSSGKSSFLNAFLDPVTDIRLPVGLDPTTAVPTYVTHCDETQVVGFPGHGGSVEFAPELFVRMNHDFLRSLGFDVRRILPFMVLESPWRQPLEHLCFIDTPGYNPGSAGTTVADDATTAEALLQADAKPESEVLEIMEPIQTTLDLYDIDVLGICAFSSVDAREYG